MIVGLVSSTGRHTTQRAVASLSDCDEVIVVEDVERRGQAWTRNELLRRAPAGSVVRFIDDDDVAMATRRMADRLIASGLDVLAASFVSTDVREEVPGDPLAAAIDCVGPWSWVARVDAIRSLEWESRRIRSTGTWHWLKMMDAGLRFGFAPDIWCYHWRPVPGGVSSASREMHELFSELRLRIAESKRDELIPPLVARMRRAGVDVPPAMARLGDIGARFKTTFGRYPHLREPRTFSEKVVARKAFDRNPMFKTWCDKLAGRAWAADILGADMAPRILYAGYVAPDELPPRCFAKANHASGWFFPFDAQEHDADVARVALDQWLAGTYGGDRAEEEYLSARRAVILEELLPDVRDVRCFVFGGVVAAVGCDAFNRTPEHRLDFYGADGKWIPTRLKHPNAPDMTRPSDDTFARAMEIAERLGRGVDFVRIDFIESRGSLWFIEATPFPYGGNLPLDPWFDEWLGDHWRQRLTG